MNLSNFYNKLNFFFYITLFIFFCSENKALSQDSQTVKKIIIESGDDNGRLLSPPTENRNERIKLIPPKSIIEKKAEQLQKDKLKAIEVKKKKEIEDARKELEKKKKLTDEKRKKEIENAIKQKKEKDLEIKTKKEKELKDLEIKRKVEE